jgi:small-conductance mechanosensitive channel/CRP-like cAMP-binding protein
VIVAPVLASVLNHPAVLAAICAAPVVYLAALAAGRWLKRKHEVPLGLMFQLFCVALAAYLPLRVLHAVELREGEEAGAGWLWHDEGIRDFQAVLVVLGVVFALQLLRRFYWQRWFSLRHGTEAPKLLQQVFGFVAFCAAVALVLKVSYGLPVDTFLAGSGIAAVVIGLAMQETLANIISGIALQIGKPFRVGDWLIIDNYRAEVVEMNWRSTRLRTNDDVSIDLPNKTVATSSLTNLSFPTPIHSNRIRVGFEYGVPPNKVREVLRRATSNAPGVLAAPPPKVFVKDFGDSAIIYEIKYGIADERRFNDIEDGIRTNIWYEARREGLTIPFPIRTLEIRRPAAAGKDAAAVRDLVSSQELLAPLDEDQKAWLLDRARTLHYGRGEKIISQGSEGCSMFVILRGDLDVVVHANGVDTVVATLHPGEAFGEMCLLTGEKRTATVVAKTDCELWEISRALLQPLMQENSGLAERLSELLARRRMETEGILAAQTPAQVMQEKQTEYTLSFRRRMGALFQI